MLSLSIEQLSTLPLIIQGGMGAAVSDWRLANAVARRGQLGVVSGTGIPREIAGVFDLLAGHHPARLRFNVEGLPSDAALYLEFDPGAQRSRRPRGN